MYPYNQFMGNQFQPVTQPTTFQPQQSQQLQRVNGLNSAKAYPTTPNSTIALFDSNEDIMYIKTTDASNFPTIRSFRFTEIQSSTPETKQFVTVEEFNQFKEEILNGKQSVQLKHQSNGSNKRNDEVRKSEQQS